MDVLEVRSLSKTFRPGFGKRWVHALSNVSFAVREAEVFALLGLNGAGKTTLTRVALDLVRPTSGDVLLFGEPVERHRWKRQVGYLPELFGVPRGMKGAQVLRSLGEMSGLKGRSLSSRVDEMLTMLGLHDAADRKVETFSKGMVLRLGIAQALLHEPRMVFLDEPTEGIDPLGRRLIRDLLRTLPRKGVTVMMNSHLLSEVELVADRIAVVHRGRMVKEGRLSELLPSNERFEVKVDVRPGLNGSWEFRESGFVWVCEVEGSGKLGQLLTELHAKGFQSLVTAKRSTLEDLFFSSLGEQ